MSKTIEATLRKPILKEDVLSTHIANTYFYQKTRPKSRRKKAAASLKRFYAICITLAVLAASAAVFVTAASFVYDRYLDFLKDKFLNSRFVTLIDGGKVGREFVKKFEFRGHAKNPSSRIMEDFLILDNPKKYSWAAAAIHFRFPLDLSGRELRLAMRGDRGGEKVNLVLRDTDHRSVRIGDTYLSSRWQEGNFSLDGLKKYIDLTRIDQLRIESGYIGESNKFDSLIDVKIYVKDLTVTRGKGI